ncbi:polysaccharide biosynthesis/export family protein [Terriglobus roseus]|uniref:Polysaccharide export outer membrane protein n=1 Tax=Terriglobus roseus TaxID=392734 RepID=A0A1H4TXD5_9BACT|nr:polysaccharide biosynthesis/export family protein [Terriglobus roseus]SEC61135.1 polysaccharide export outer membrane protein [Terriglobus roseus]
MKHGSIAALLGLVLCAPLTTSGQFLHHGTGRYQLRSNDEIKVTYHLTPDLNATVSVQPDGYVALPEIGEVRLAGLSLDEATEAITMKAAARLNKPEVSVEIVRFEKPHIFVGGNVGKPGQYTLNGPLTALQAIQVAEGFKDTANMKHVLLIRPIGEGVGETTVLNLKRSGSKHTTTETFVQDGDTLIVPENNLTAVSRYVKLINPGVYYPLK